MMPLLGPRHAAATARGSRVIEVLDTDVGVALPWDALVRGSWPDEEILERVPPSGLDAMPGQSSGTIGAILHWSDLRDGSGWRTLGSIIASASRLLDETGTLILAFAPQRDTAEAVVDGRAVATERSEGGRLPLAGVARSLTACGFGVQRWRISSPSLSDPRVVYDERLAHEPGGPELVATLSRIATAATFGPGIGSSGQSLASGSGRDGQVEPTDAGACLVLASRKTHPADDGDGDGWAWIMPEPGRVDPWRVGWVLARDPADDAWELIPYGDTEDLMSGPFVARPRRVPVIVGRNAEEAIAAALDEHGATSEVVRGWLAGWWSACRRLLAAPPSVGAPIDIGPHRFTVSVDGGWHFLPGVLFHRFGLPAESLAYGAMIRLIRAHSDDRGLPWGLPGIVSSDRVCRLLLGSIGLEVEDEHILLWQELEVDLAVRSGPPGVAREDHRRRMSDLDDTPLWIRLFRQPPERHARALQAGRLGSIAEELGQEMERLRAEVRAERGRLEQQRAQAVAARDEVVARVRHLQDSLERQESEAWDRLEAMREIVREILREKEAMVDDLHRELAWRDWQVAWHRALPARLERGPDGRSRFDEERDVVSGSDMFDAAWYLDRYPDVVQTGMDPGFHYVRHGAVEGRDPGPTFETRAHVAEHPAVITHGANPLVYALQGRAVIPLSLSAAGSAVQPVPLREHATEPVVIPIEAPVPAPSAGEP